MKFEIPPCDAVVLANGEFPHNPIPLSILTNAQHLICCDGAAISLAKFMDENQISLPIDAIVGDGDSLPSSLRKRFKDKIILDKDQETNDLTKAITYAINQKHHSIHIIGACGLREDHTLGNISLLLTYAQLLHIQMFTEYGVFTPIRSTTTFTSFKNQQVSVISLPPVAPISSEGLQYPIHERRLFDWWEGTLNSALGKSFTLTTEDNRVLVFQTYEPKRIAR